MPHVFAQCRVLLVDPDADRLVAWARVARDRGFEVDTAEPAGALDQASLHSYGIAALDLELVGPHGPTLIEELCDQHPDLLFVALARSSALHRPRAHKLDAAIAAVVALPLEPDDLIRALGEAFELRERRTRTRPVTVDGATVLLVEADPADAEAIRAQLSEVCGARVRRVGRLDEAIRALHGATFDFVIADLALPDARGLDAVHRLLPLAPGTPLIVVTGTDDESLALQALQDGVQDYLVKSALEPGMLRRTLRHARERKHVLNRLVHMARHDPLTGVANRPALRERIETTLARAQRCELAFAVMFVDLDYFKAVNDTYGHDAGDAVLREVGDRLRGAVRTSDLVARLGGDEFAVFLDDVGPEWSALEIAERILVGLEAPIRIGDRELVVTASIGVTSCTGANQSIDDILKAADSAMYLAKRRGRNNVQVYGAAADAHRARLALSSDLLHALDRGELSLHFQPQYTIDCSHVVAFEALLRWNRGGVLVSPADFIPLLEDNGRIIPVGEWVLDRACEQLARWHTGGAPNLRMGVNLSARQIVHPGLVDCVSRCIDRYAIPASCIELELTESVLMRDTRRATTALADLRALGVRLAIDDFGTGYSSLAYLSRFAVDCLKIDRSFIHEVDADRERALITSTIVTLGHHLGLEVVAEGVETSAQLAFLSAAQCDIVQGYLLGRPAAASTFAAGFAGDRPPGNTALA